MKVRMIQLGEVCDFTYGDSLKEENRHGGKVPVYGSNGVVGWHDSSLTNGPAIIVGRKGSIGEVNWSSQPCFPIDTTYFIEKTKIPCDLRWLYFTLLKLDLTRFNKSAAVPGLNRDDAYEQFIPFPDLSEQQQIVWELERAEGLRRTRRYALELADTFLPAAFLAFFGDISFPRVALEEVAKDERNSFVNGPFGSDLLTNELTDTGVPVIYIRNISSGRYERKSSVFVTITKAAELEFCNAKPGDILVAKVGDPPGIAAIYPSTEPDGIVTQDVIRIRPNTEIVSPYYLQNFLNSQLGRREMSKIMVEGTRLRFSLGQFKEISIPLPPLSLQMRFAELVERHERLRSVQRESLRHAEHLFATLLHRAFSDQMIAQDAHYEPTSILKSPAGQEQFDMGLPPLPDGDIIDLRAALNSYVISQLPFDQQLGRTKMEKIDEILEYHCGINLHRNRERNLAGPVDYQSRLKVEEKARERKWFSPVEHKLQNGKTRIEYIRGKDFSAALPMAEKFIGNRKEVVDGVLKLFKPLSADDCSIYATLFAAWNDLLILRRPISDDAIVRESTDNWHPAKKKISRTDWNRGLDWLRKHQIIPTGRGKLTVQTKAK